MVDVSCHVIQEMTTRTLKDIVLYPLPFKFFGKILPKGSEVKITRRAGRVQYVETGDLTGYVIL